MLLVSVVSITTDDVDLLCNVTNSILFRDTNSWQCGEISNVTTYYTPSSISSVTTVQGDGSELTTCLDNNWFNVTENTGSPALNINFTFTNVNNFRNVVICQEYTGTHDLHMKLYNYNLNSFVDINDIGNTDSINCNYKSLGGDVSQFINSGNVIIQINHPQNGVNSHIEYIDCLKLER